MLRPCADRGGQPGVAVEMTGRDKVVGIKQVRRALTQHTARRVYLACDAEPRLTLPLRELCASQGLTADETLTMQQLGRACGIAVPAAAVALLDAELHRFRRV